MSLDEAAWRVQETADYLCSRGYGNVTLQFPDSALQSAARVAVAVQAACAARGHAVQAYILADTTYNPLSVDEVAAAHVNADCVVHYGRASLTKLSRVPAYFVFPEQQFDAAAAAACLASASLLARLGAACSGGAEAGDAPDADQDASSSSGSPPFVLVFLDQPLLHQLETFRLELVRLVAEQHGAAAAARLLFPAVPQRHMEPEGRQQRGALAGAAVGPAGCCGIGSCNGEQQQREAEQQSGMPASGCCQAAGGCAVPQAAGGEAAAAAAAAAGTAAAAEHVGGAAAAATAAAPCPAGSEAGSAGAQPAAEAAAADDGSALHSLAGYQWHLPAGVPTRCCGLAWVGAPDAPALLHLQLTYSGCPWAVLDPAALPAAAAPGSAASDGSGGGGGGAPGAAAAALSEGLPLEISRALRRRYFLVQKARDACIVGILVGTLGAAGYGAAVAGLRAAAAAAGKKSYTLLMGKPSPAKLANFPEIEVFVLVADPQGQILDSKEYLAPIITPHEAMLAWGAAGEGEWDEQRYSLGFEAAAAAGQAAGAGGAAPPLPRPRRQEPRFSLLAGGYTGDGGSSESEDEAPAGDAADEQQADMSAALALHAQQALVVTAAPQGRSDLVQPKSAADYLLHKRSWQGVEAPLVGAATKAVEAAVEGRSGRAAGYADEPSKQQAAPQSAKVQP
ncbi:hypothetical protein ABPG75_009122 [Micractinium tetrahymenae]